MTTRDSCGPCGLGRGRGPREPCVRRGALQHLGGEWSGPRGPRAPTGRAPARRAARRADLAVSLRAVWGVRGSFVMGQRRSSRCQPLRRPHGWPQSTSAQTAVPQNALRLDRRAIRPVVRTSAPGDSNRCASGDSGRSRRRGLGPGRWSRVGRTISEPLPARAASGPGRQRRAAALVVRRPRLHRLATQQPLDPRHSAEQGRLGHVDAVVGRPARGWSGRHSGYGEAGQVAFTRLVADLSLDRTHLGLTQVIYAGRAALPAGREGGGSRSARSVGTASLCKWGPRSHSPSTDW